MNRVAGFSILAEMSYTWKVVLKCYLDKSKKRKGYNHVKWEATVPFCIGQTFT